MQFFGCFHYLSLQFLLSCKQVSKTVRLLRKSSNICREPLNCLLVKPHLDHHLIHDEVYNSAFHQKLQTFQYNASLAITGTTRGTSRENLHQELNLESLQLSAWYREFCCFVKGTLMQI